MNSGATDPQWELIQVEWITLSAASQRCGSCWRCSVLSLTCENQFWDINYEMLRKKGEVSLDGGEPSLTFQLLNQA